MVVGSGRRRREPPEVLLPGHHRPGGPEAVQAILLARAIAATRRGLRAGTVVTHGCARSALEPCRAACVPMISSRRTWPSPGLADPAVGEGGGIRHGCHEGAGDDRADARNGRQPPAGCAGGSPSPDPPPEGVDRAVQPSTRVTSVVRPGRHAPRPESGRPFRRGRSTGARACAGPGLDGRRMLDLRSSPSATELL
jgi:hypothetical protein